MQWEGVQEDYIQLLQEGARQLKESEIKGLRAFAGNYLIYNGSQPLYIGESLNVEKRLTQHWRKNSAFSRKYMAYKEEKGLEIDVKVQSMAVSFGRKEMEEYGMYLWQTPLNSRHNKRKFPYSNPHAQLAWKDLQTKAKDVINLGLEAFQQQVPLHDNRLLAANPGVYGVIKEDEIIYVGEAIAMNERIKTHLTTTRFSALRRNIARQHFGLILKSSQEIGKSNSVDKKKMYLTKAEDALIDSFLAGCQLIVLPVAIGRLELEEKLIASFEPEFNRK